MFKVTLQFVFICMNFLMFSLREVQAECRIIRVVNQGKTGKIKIPSIKGKAISRKPQLLFLSQSETRFSFLKANESKACLTGLIEARKNNWTKAYALVEAPVCYRSKQLLQWIDYQNHRPEHTFIEIASFILMHPQWPNISSLREKAEKLLNDTVSPSFIKKYFDVFAPLTGIGALYKIKTCSPEDRGEVQQLWSSCVFTLEDQQQYLKLYGKYLSFESLREKFFLLWDLKEKDQAAEIKSYILSRFVDKKEEKKCPVTRQDLENLSLNFHPHDIVKEKSLLSGRNREEFFVLFQEIFLTPNIYQSFPLSWWEIQKSFIQECIKERQYEKAYFFATHHALKNSIHRAFYSEAEWLAGWIALYFLKRPLQSLPHFIEAYRVEENLDKKIQYAYWASLAYKLTGNLSKAQEWQKKAACYPYTFYGYHSYMKQKDLTVKEKKNFDIPHAFKNGIHGDLLSSCVLLSLTGWKKYLPNFLNRSYEYCQSEEECKYLILCTEEMISKTFYPLLSFKANLEKALILAVIHQETHFDSTAISPKGALGLMQIIPQTAQKIASRWKEKVTEYQLLYDYNLNIKIGTSYLDDLLKRHKGCYVQTLAAYNAGSARVEQWIKNYGNPSEDDLGLLGWIEAIPFSETKNYVKQVLHSLFIYRFLLASE